MVDMAQLMVQVMQRLLPQLSSRASNTMPTPTTHTPTQSTMSAPETTKPNQKAATVMLLLVNTRWSKLTELDVLLTTQPTPSTDLTQLSTKKPPLLKLLLQLPRLLLLHSPLITHQSVSRTTSSFPTHSLIFIKSAAVAHPGAYGYGAYGSAYHAPIGLFRRMKWSSNVKLKNFFWFQPPLPIQSLPTTTVKSTNDII